VIFLSIIRNKIKELSLSKYSIFKYNNGKNLIFQTMSFDPTEIMVLSIYDMRLQRYRDEKLRVCDKYLITLQT